MRQIKFRAIDQFSDDFVYAPAFFIDKDNNQGYLAWGIDDHQCVKKETVGQFTGLHDKNGKEIYEGDVLDHIPYNIPKVVTYLEGSFRIDGVTMHKENTEHLEIVGNIHQNKDLLK